MKSSEESVQYSLNDQRRYRVMKQAIYAIHTMTREADAVVVVVVASR